MSYKRNSNKLTLPIMGIGVLIIFKLINDHSALIAEIITYSLIALPILLLIYWIIKTRFKTYNNVALAEIDNMKGTEFEKYLGSVFKNKGYSVIHTGNSGDYGADLILIKSQEKIIVQAKRYAYSVGVAAIQEVISAREYYGGTKAMVITNNYFTKNAIIMAKRCNVDLIDRNALIKIISPLHT